jgi:hypothetical protein
VVRLGGAITVGRRAALAAGRRIVIVAVAALCGETRASALRRAESALHVRTARRTRSTRTRRRAARTGPPVSGIGPPRSCLSIRPTGPVLRIVTVAGAIIAVLPGAVTRLLDRAIAFLPVTTARSAHRQPAWPERRVEGCRTGRRPLPRLRATALTARAGAVPRVWVTVVMDVGGWWPVTGLVPTAWIDRTTWRAVAGSALAPGVRAAWVRTVSGLITIARSQPQRLRRKLGRLLPFLTWTGIVPDLTWRLRLMPDLAWQIRTQRLDRDGLVVHRPCQQRCAWRGAFVYSGRRWLAPRRGRPARRDHRSDGPPDPEWVKPLLGLYIAGLGPANPPPLTRLRLPAIIRATLARLTLPWLAPALTPPGHD